MVATLTAQQELALRQLGSQSASLTPAAARLLVQLALAVPYRDGWRLTPAGLRRYQRLPKSPLHREKRRPVIDDILDRVIPLARAAGISKPDAEPDAEKEVSMRCYLMRDGQIQGVTFLKEGSDDELIAQAKEVFVAHANQGFEGVEVWSGTRSVYRSSPRINDLNSN